MIEIIPGIVEREWSESKKKVKSVENLTEWVHIDVSDGIFTSNITWDEPQDLSNLETSLKIEVHLMITHPWRHIDKWLQSPVSRIIVHYESFPSHEATFMDIKEFIQKVRKSGKEIILSFNISTRWQVAEDILPLVDGVLMLSVEPGYSGQEFHESVSEKIKSLREKFENINIEADGGVNPKKIKDIIKAGANRFVSASYIFSHANPSQAIEEYKIEIEK